MDGGNALKNQLGELLFYFEDIQKAFNKKVYADNFEKFYEDSKPLYEKIEKEYFDKDDKEAYICDLAEAFVDRANKEIDSLPKRKKEIAIFKFNLTLVTYVFPSMTEFRSDATNLLSKKVTEKWNKNFPKEQVSVTSFGEINGGFRKRFCYITTATCKALNKSDKCAELESFRNYRDNYLEKCEDGILWINRYYDLAPSIIKGIDKEENSEAIYQNIWDEYLKPCYKLIQNNENETCKKKYEEMVEKLALKYVYC